MANDKKKPSDIDKEVQEFVDKKLVEVAEERLKEIAEDNPVAAAMYGVSKIAKEGTVKDKHGKVLYDYASADAFYSEVRDELAKWGLSFWCSENEWEIITVGGDSNWLRVTYAMGLSTDGKRPAEEDLELITQISPITNAQGCQINRTYAVKGYLRGKFLIATESDDDLEQQKNEFKGEVTTGQVETRTQTRSTGAGKVPKWELDESTLEFKQVAGNPGTDKAARELFKYIHALYAPGSKKKTKAQLTRLQKIWEKNEWLIDGMPGGGKKTLYELAQQEGIKTSEFDQIKEQDKEAGIEEGGQADDKT